MSISGRELDTTYRQPLWRSAAAGSLQLEVVWRLVGVAMLLMNLRVRGSHPLGMPWDALPPAYHAMLLTSVLLVVLGPRLVCLLASAAAWLAILHGYIFRADLEFLADEYLLFAALPVLGALGTLLASDAARAAGQLWLLRMATLVTLGFAGFHKLNHDFLDPATSCATLLGERLVERWSLPGAPGPVGVLLAEALAPVLLVLYPRLGALWLLALAAGLGHVGPYAFNALLAALSLAFLPPAAAEAWRARSPWWLLGWLVGVAAAGLASAHLHIDTPDFLWWPYLLFEAVLVGVTLLVILSRGTGESWGRPRRRTHPWLPGGAALRWLCISATLVLTFQGLAPYLGLRYRLAFAMLSNLRVDDARWNSLVVPSWVRVRDDRHVHVLAVTGLDGKPINLSSARVRLLRPGVYSPQEFRRRLVETRLRRVQGDLLVRHRGELREFHRFTIDPALQAFIDALPDERLLQDSLSLEGRQRCVH